ncbi:hypothetical protein SOPEG_2635 [Candidatus Sodalis pierantonius str. SOPE]|uniref:Uncharacterized protein n=1 Tax=Candidatus Sodalis pierantonii str. SOPE TaxID=2342 RepID=W0HKE4_9GAMM|nr:hypothetical protein [Candidatus Sodalis pierantonius]AHF74289.1 hypothetical protein SOPEG_2635 [Candidatus Sodalis pierantonius str. SOPE]
MNDDIFEFDIDAELAKAEKNAEKKLMKCRSRCRRKTIAKGVKFNQRGGGMAAAPNG